MTHPLAPIREGQEAAKDHWSSIVREAIIRELVANRDGFHADSLAPVGVPDEHKSIVGSQIAKLVNEGMMEECGRRKSAIASRNGAKSNVYRMTGRGGERLARVGSANPEGSPPAPAGANASGGPSTGQAVFRPFAASGAGSSAAADPGEPLSLLPVGAGAGRPLSPLTDAEAA